MYTNSRNKATEELIRKLLKKGSVLAQIVTASSLRIQPGLTENEKYLAAKREIILSWKHYPVNPEQSLEKAIKNKTVDDLIDFATSDLSFNAAVNILEAFGAKDSKLVFRLVILLKEFHRNEPCEALKAIKSDNVPKQAIDYVIKWATEENDVDTAIKAADLREVPGLTQPEIETLLEKRKKQGDIISSIILADMRKIPGLTTTDIEEITNAIKT